MPGACDGLPHGFHGCAWRLVLRSAIARVRRRAGARGNMLCQTARCSLETRFVQPDRTCQNAGSLKDMKAPCLQRQRSKVSGSTWLCARPLVVMASCTRTWTARKLQASTDFNCSGVVTLSATCGACPIKGFLHAFPQVRVARISSSQIELRLHYLRSIHHSCRGGGLSCVPRLTGELHARKSRNEVWSLRCRGDSSVSHPGLSGCPAARIASGQSVAATTFWWLQCRAMGCLSSYRPDPGFSVMPDFPHLFKTKQNAGPATSNSPRSLSLSLSLPSLPLPLPPSSPYGLSIWPRSNDCQGFHLNFWQSRRRLTGPCLLQLARAKSADVV